MGLCAGLALSLRKTERPSSKNNGHANKFSSHARWRPAPKTIGALFFFSGIRTQEQRSVVSDLAEVKHLGDGVGERIE